MRGLRVTLAVFACAGLAGAATNESPYVLATMDALLTEMAATNAPARTAKSGAVTNAVRPVATSVTNAPSAPAPITDWTWDALAARASARADAAKLALLEVAAKRQSVQDKLAWRDPQLRLGRTWEDSRDRGSGHPENGDGDTYTLGLRCYISNPFVNHYLQRAGEAQVAALEARATAAAYAVASEVRSLCLEENHLSRELAFQEATITLWSTIRAYLQKRLDQGVEKSPLDTLKAEIAGEKVGMQRTELQLRLRQTRRQIAFLTGVPEGELKIRYTPPEPPATNRAQIAALTEAAFARRPDLVCALAEYTAAQAGVKAARARQIPWFEFLEGTYSHSTDSSVNWSSKGVRGHKSGRADDWQVRIGVTIPVFSWLGDSVKVSRLVEEAADVRVQALYAGIRNEIAAAFDDFCVADARFTRLSDNKNFLPQMKKRLAEFAQTALVRPDEVARAQMELVDYRRLRDRIEYEWVRRILLLETVTGGPLGPVR